MQLYINARFLTQPLSGVQRYSIEMSRQILEVFPNTVFLSPKNILHQDIAHEFGAKIIGNHTGHVWEQTSLPNYLKKMGCPPLFNPGNTAPLFYANNFITIHDLAFKHFPQWNSKAFVLWYNFLVPRITKRAKHIFTVSQTVKEELQKELQLPFSKITVAYNGLSNTFLVLRNETVPKEKIILAVGSLNQRKNHHALIQAFQNANLSKDYQLVIVGGRHSIFAHETLSIDTGRITVINDADDTALALLYNKAEITVSLSAYEGFGIPVLEGLYFGCKVLCSDIEVYHELFEGKVYFCNQVDINDISTKLDDMVKSPYPTAVASVVKKYNYTPAAQIILNAIVQEHSK